MFLDTLSILATLVRVGAIFQLCRLTEAVDNALDRLECKGERYFARGVPGLLGGAALQAFRTLWRRLASPFRVTALQSPSLPQKRPCGCGE